MSQGYNKGEGPHDDSSWPETVERDGIKLIHGGVEPLREFDLREYHDRVTGMPAGPPPMPHAPRHRR